MGLVCRIFVFHKNGIFGTWEKWLFKHSDVAIYDHDSVKHMSWHSVKRCFKKPKNFDETYFPIRYAIPAGGYGLYTKYNSRTWGESQSANNRYITNKSPQNEGEF